MVQPAQWPHIIALNERWHFSPSRSNQSPS
eukprot:Gb_41174 [translate_table: standard]